MVLNESSSFDWSAIECDALGSTKDEISRNFVENYVEIHSIFLQWLINYGDPFSQENEQTVILLYRKKRFSRQEEDKSIRITSLCSFIKTIPAFGDCSHREGSHQDEIRRRFKQGSWHYIWLSTTEAEPRFRKILLRNPHRFRGLRMSCTGPPLCTSPPFNPKEACSLVPRWFSATVSNYSPSSSRVSPRVSNSLS